MVFLLCFIPTVRARLVGQKSRPVLDRLEIRRMVKITKLGISVWLVLGLLETFFEKSNYIIGDALKFFIAFSLGRFEPSSDMTPDKRHRDGIWAILRSLGRRRGEDSVWRKNERTWRLATLLLTGIRHGGLLEN